MTASILGEREQEAIRDAFAGLERDVEVTLELGPSAAPVTLLAAGGREIDASSIAHDVVQAVCMLGGEQRTAPSTSSGARAGTVGFTVVEHDEPGPWPRTTIGPPGGPTVAYLGMPLGYELSTLVHAIVEAGRAEPSLSAATLALLDALDRDVAIDVFVTPT